MDLHLHLSREPGHYPRFVEHPRSGHVKTSLCMSNAPACLIDANHRQLMNAIQVEYGPAMLCAKYFVITQLKRIFCPRGMKGVVWWALHALAAVTIVYYISSFFTFLFQCMPRE